MTDEKRLRIVKFTAENIKRIKVAEISPSGDLVVVGGGNDQGKSSCLDAIEMAMRGEKATPPEPVRRGAKDGRVVLDLGDIQVTRTYGANGSRKLIVANKEGARFPSPQAMLDRLYGALSFDPLAFERMEPKAQAEALRRLVGLDLSALDGKRARLYEERTEQNRSVKALEVKVDTCERYPDAPGEEVSIATLLEDLQRAAELQRLADEAGQQARQKARDVQSAEDRQAAAYGELIQMRARLIELEDAWHAAEVALEARKDELAVAHVTAGEVLAAVPDVAPVKAALITADATNRQVRVNREYATAQGDLREAKAAAGGLTSRIDALDAERLAALAAVAFPVPGLGISEDGVTLGGLPFEQASTSDRIRVSVAIGLAENQGLRVLLVRDGSLLGAEKLRILGEMAAAADVQVWLELLQEAPDGRTTVFLVDGEVQR